MSEVTRRRFLALAASLAGTALPASSVAASAFGPTALALAANSARSARAVGRAYLAATPNERAADALVERLTARLPAGRASLASDSDVELRAQLHRAIEQDFAAERTVQLDGWLLSQTEARLCALTALAFDP